ncbi:MAG: hypothetical protein EBV40_06660 [Actinobacteria bacterium]|nr:hypothetical protein [Actinomycetota bacterium]
MSAKQKILVARAIFPDQLADLESTYEVISNQADDVFSPDLLRQHLASVDAALVAGSERIDASALADAKHLKIVANISVGYNNFDVPAISKAGIMATNLTDDVALQLLANAGATVGALIALILMFGPISGAHFNPVVTAATCIFDARPWRELAPYAVSQTIGGIVGAAIANSMFSLDILGPSTKIREGSGIWLGEVVATVGLLLVIFLIARGPRPDAVPVAVGVWIGGAYWFTSSTSLANPAVSIARSFTESFAGIARESVPMFIVMQLIGLVIATLILSAFIARKPASAAKSN